ncbi:response regulator transcription factor [Acetivibrio cellulolyticus]|uniref:response regulator transcription factor n=1 Tax=Acetivibrio cellulolyticus TaxID=35830 RepID=UPI0001E2E2ED|nr:response regulator transcription factor [Acetivibrio cellulolyticus]
MKKIVLVEDEVYMREELTELLKKSAYQVDAIDVFDNTTEHILQSVPDLVLLDLNLPGISGFQICQEIKRKSSIPVLILTSRDQMKDELHALELGADEYLTKPCRKERLLARISNVLKRYEGRANLLEGEGFLLDRLTYTLYINNQSTVLPKNQGKLLEVFLLHEDGIVTKDELNISLWGTTEFIDENALQVNLTRLRKTMLTLNMTQKIVSISGKGYEITSEVLYEK